LSGNRVSFTRAAGFIVTNLVWPAELAGAFDTQRITAE
jgi:hypothetical protein